MQFFGQLPIDVSFIDFCGIQASPVDGVPNPANVYAMPSLSANLTLLPFLSDSKSVIFNVSTITK